MICASIALAWLHHWFREAIRIQEKQWDEGGL